MNKSQKVTLCVVLLIVLLIAWGLFPLFFKWLMIGIGSKETALKDFGTFGDIYGSLNTLFTSATLIIVMYSAYLQRQANKDARDAMERQLQQAKEDTEEQLKQAREATEQQILNAQQLAHIQLEHARQNSKEQLELAQATHNAQMRESKHAIFLNMFNTLLNQKNEQKRNVLVINEENNKRIEHESIFNDLEEKFEKNFSNLFSSSEIKSTYEIETILMRCLENIGGVRLFKNFRSYFYVYESLIKLIKSSDLNEKEKNLYFQVIANTMSISEQICLMWTACGDKRLYESLKDTQIFWFNYEDCIDFIKFSYDQSFFSNESFLKFWDEHSENG
ncbi:hypothetical protein J5N52_12410 [Acinetobacter soli]|uniref:hypothetical protein n=1 Tax=Acinetobacter soli TaxID=487316 RepID=UPI001ABBEBC4|nr:hypothetical protein [Acinetobacter soli]MBO3672810.1 hypothetical protein [Acinetobacter soli]